MIIFSLFLFFGNLINFKIKLMVKTHLFTNQSKCLDDFRYIVRIDVFMVMYELNLIVISKIFRRIENI